MATKRYLEILETVKKNNPAFYEKLMKDEKTKKAEASRAPKPKAKSNPLDGVTPEMIKAVQAMTESGPAKPDKDYIALIREYRDQRKCTLEQAVIEVNRRVPLAKEACIKEANQQPDPAGPKYSQEEIKGYMLAVTQYQIEKNCTRLQAVKNIDILKPGLREAYVKFVNK
jgi:hypothetical protein